MTLGQAPASVLRISEARSRGEQRAEEYLFGIRCAAEGWPRGFCNTPDAQRGYDQLAQRLRKKAA